jgi:hypothetical protein
MKSSKTQRSSIGRSGSDTRKDESFRKKCGQCGDSLRDKLYLASYDIISVNLSTRPLFSLYQILDFLFIAAFPLNHIYNFSKSANNYSKVIIEKASKSNSSIIANQT